MLALIGLIPRLIHLDGTFLGDELSTLYIVSGNDLFGTIEAVHSSKEISPPLYFLLAELFTGFGGPVELARVPALIAGVLCIPLSYLVGARAIGRSAGVAAAAAMALNPFMVYYSTDSRAYTVAIGLLLVSTLAMLIAVQGGGRRWWVIYGAATCLCMYAHYTTAFVLGAQLLWLLWARPEARKAALLANAGAALAFMPWITGVLDDFSSPTIEILSDLQGDGFAVKRDAFLNWSFGYPFNLPEALPGKAALVVGVGALAIGAGWSLFRLLRRRGSPERAWRAVEPRGVPLVLALLVATPLAETALLLAGGSDLLGARNLNTASGGYMLSIGAMLLTAGPMVGAACVAAVLGVFAFGTAQSLDREASTIDFKSAAETIEAEAGPDDVIIDMLSPLLAPVPLTSIDTYLPQTFDEYRLYLTEGPPPFLTFPPPPLPILDEALEAAAGGTAFLVAGEGIVSEDSRGRIVIRVPPADPAEQEQTVTLATPGTKIVESWSFAGIGPVKLYKIAVGD